MEIVPFFMLSITTFVVILVAFVLFFVAHRPNKSKESIVLLETKPPDFCAQSNPFEEMLNRQINLSNLFEGTPLADPDREEDFNYLVDKKVKQLSNQLTTLKEKKSPTVEGRMDSKSVMSLFEPKANKVSDIFKKREDFKKNIAHHPVKKDESLEQLFEHSEILSGKSEKQKKELPAKARVNTETPPPVQPRKETARELVPEKVSHGEDPYQLKKYEVEYLLALLGRKKAS